jgi:trimethylamine--corrinoid protein Co-methyltransferase
MSTTGNPRSKRRRRAKQTDGERPSRRTEYKRLRNPFTPQTVFTEDRVQAMHDSALRVLEELGIRILLPEARALFAQAGALVDEDSSMVRIGRDIVDQTLATAPRSYRLRAGDPERDMLCEAGTLNFQAGSGCPNATDIERGRRPGTLADFEEILKVTQGFDVLHQNGPHVEPQDVPVELRHYAFTLSQLSLTDKHSFVYARGRAQALDCFEMFRLAFELDEDRFRREAWCTTIVNTNSPRQIDIPMAQALIDFARHGQHSIVTPFCLAGAMAPVTAAGALTLQHAEAMAAIALTQLAGPGAPVMYGGFSSNVDMKSGAPAFGTPEHVKMQLGAGQLARLLGLPWRSAAGTASNLADAQGAGETVMSLWGAVLAGATHVIHCAGWLEGGLTFGFEKMICDLEAVQGIAELCGPTPAADDDIGMDALADVQPGGHFFSTAHTMKRYRTAFYEPVVSETANFGTWTEAGARDAIRRAHEVWKTRLAGYTPPAACDGVAERLAFFIDRRTREGGAPPES